jgi:hypothetical protein
MSGTTEVKMAPVQGYTPGIPWSMHLEAYDVYRKKYGAQQALIEGGCRGGFGVIELDEFIPGWRDKVSEIGKLRAEIAEARSLVDRHKRTAEIYAIERDHARACYDKTVRILTGIHALLYPPRFTDNDGRVWEFRSPIAQEQMQELSDRIRALPDEIEKTDAAMKAVPGST